MDCRAGTAIQRSSPIRQIPIGDAQLWSMDLDTQASDDVARSRGSTILLQPGPRIVPLFRGRRESTATNVPAAKMLRPAKTVEAVSAPVNASP